MMTEDGVTGVELGPTWLPSKVVLKTLATFSTASYNFNIEASNPPKCAKYAILEITMTSGANSSSISMVLPNGLEVLIGMGIRAARAIHVPIVNNEVRLKAYIGTTSTTRTLGINLIGFE
jgi:hypothetical protein